MGSACLLNGLPKSGTFLLKKVVGMLPEMRPVEFHLDARTFAESTPAYSPRATIPVGVDGPRLVTREDIDHLLQQLERGSYATAHVRFSAELAAILAETEIKMVSIIRDPRDVVISHAKYIPNAVETRWSEHYRSLSDSDRIMVSMTGLRKQAGRHELLNIRERLESVLAWRSKSFNYTSAFERLVGPAGGGSREMQVREIGAIAQHLKIECDGAQIAAVGDRAFGDSPTFRRGVIGSWRECFTEEHKRVCKELVGRLLIDLGYETGLDW